MIPVFIIIFFTAVDQITKYAVSSSMQIGESFTFIKYILNITYHTNEGAAFGMLSGHRWVFMSVSSLAIAAMTAALAYVVVKKYPLLIQIALSFFISGGIGNMIDRISKGAVVDFLEFDFIEFAIFNIADSCICIGFALFFIFLILNRNNEMIFTAKKPTHNETETEMTDEGNGM